jgi:NADH:ubiquinone reductase (H+-translocating)
VLMTGARNRVETFIDWGWDYLSRSRGPQVLDRTGAVEIDWGEDVPPGTNETAAAQRTTA